MTIYDRYKLQITLETDMLGVTPLSAEIFQDYVAAAAIDEGVDAEDLAEEEETIPEVSSGWTGFHRDANDNPLIYDYVVKGFCKGACYGLRRSKGTLSSKITAYKKQIDHGVFITPRQITLQVPENQAMVEAPEDGSTDVPMSLPNVRPLRASTAKGERVAIAYSESVPPGTTATFTIDVLANTPITEKVLREWFDYGRFHGLGGWRNAGWGRFTYEMEKVED